MRQKAEIFDYVNIFLMTIIMFIMVYPMWYIIVGAFNEGADYARGGVYFWARKLTIENFQAIFYQKAILQAFWITILKSGIGTITSVFFTTWVAFGITRPKLKGKKIYIPVIMFTMFFSGGLIPYFILISDIGLYDNFLVYIIPTLFSVWYMIIIQSFLRELPEALMEAATIDGASEYKIFFAIVLPLSKPVLASITLFTVVGHWNVYFDSMMFTSSQHLETIQYYLRKVISDPGVSGSISNAGAAEIPDSLNTITPQSVKFATMVVTALPIIMVYPFLQKYFVKGLTIGAVKG